MTKSNKVKKVPKKTGTTKAKSTVKASKVKKETIKKVKVEEKPKATKASKVKKEKIKKTQVEKKPRATKATVSFNDKKKKKTNVDKAKLITPEHTGSRDDKQDHHTFFCAITQHLP